MGPYSFNNFFLYRDDLGIYLKVLRSSMIELINEDYADFVNLSTNLVGLDRSLLRLKEPLLRHQVRVVSTGTGIAKRWLKRSINQDSGICYFFKDPDPLSSYGF